jgi:hypothetical protein
MTVSTYDAIYTMILYACAIGQAIFVGSWLTAKWYKSLVGIALMFKSASLCVTLAIVSIIRYTHATFDPITGYRIYIALFFMLFIGITFQDVAILRELAKGKRANEV